MYIPVIRGSNSITTDSCTCTYWSHTYMKNNIISFSEIYCSFLVQERLFSNINCCCPCTCISKIKSWVLSSLCQTCLACSFCSVLNPLMKNHSLDSQVDIQLQIIMIECQKHNKKYHAKYCDISLFLCHLKTLICMSSPKNELSSGFIIYN